MRSGETAQLAIQLREPRVEEVDTRQRRLHHRQSSGREHGRIQPGACRRPGELAADRDTVVEQLRVHALQPRAALVSQRLPQLHPAAQLEQVSRRHPRLR
jgi:hypothetical protein